MSWHKGTAQKENTCRKNSVITILQYLRSKAHVSNNMVVFSNDFKDTLYEYKYRHKHYTASDFQYLRFNGPNDAFIGD